MTWAIWGKTRTAADEDVIHFGEKSTRVDFEFIYNQQSYRIIRTRQRKGGSTLDFQIVNGERYNSLSEKNLRDTQHKIIDCLKIDYDTFINSAYLKQGRADEFMLRRAAERKKILADLLKLDQYEDLANQAKDLAKEYKIKGDNLSRNLENCQSQLDEQEAIKLELDHTNRDLEYLQSLQQENSHNLQQVKNLHSQRENWVQRQQWQENQRQNLSNQINQLQQEKQQLETELKQLNLILEQQAEIEANYTRWQQLREQDNQLRQKFQAYQQALETKRELEQELREESNNLILTIQQEKTRLANLVEEELELNKTITRKPEITEDLAKLNDYRQKLQQLDAIQEQVAPLRQRQQTLQTELAREKAKLEAKLEEFNHKEVNLQASLAEVPSKREQFFNLQKQLKKLDDTKIYQQRVKEKGEEKRSLQQKYLTQQNNLAQQIEKLQKKLETLSQDHAICPLCEQELDEVHLDYVISKTQQEQTQIETESWQYETEIRNCERELEKLIAEYKQLNQELAIENNLKQDYAKLESQLDLVENIYLEYDNLQGEKSAIITLLDHQIYAPELRQELQVIEQQLKELDYNQETHALIRKQESSLYRVEFQYAKIKEAENRLTKLAQQKPELETQINNLETQLEALTKTSPLQQKILTVAAEINKINYDSNFHNQVREDLQKLQSYQNQYTELQQAQKQVPLLQEKIKKITVSLTNYEQEKSTNQLELENIKQQLVNLTDYTQEVQKLEEEFKQRRGTIDQLLTKKGALEQTINQLNNQKNEIEKLKDDLKESQKNYRIYRELGEAFGKNGIQTLMIENILPDLEAEANRILARLSSNQFHVQFLTQKPKSSRSKKSSSQFKDTLEIIISDAHGTRPYETYSGGEAFRINFSVRLALSRILAGRAGTALQFLMIDEGFGTQDTEGCERLIAALNDIADEFACILIVTHMPQFKEAFQSRIEVYKTDQGSQIMLST
jgi:exonuclease SbcC